MQTLCREKKLGALLTLLARQPTNCKSSPPTTVKTIPCKFFVKKRSRGIVKPAGKTANKLQIFPPTTVKSFYANSL
jgi:hypothetical protein